MWDDMLDPADGRMIGFVTFQRSPSGDIMAVQHKVRAEEPRPEEFVLALRWMADALEIEALPEAD